MYRLIKIPEKDYCNQIVDWNIGLYAELSPPDQCLEDGRRFYVVWTGQCEPFLTLEQVEDRPDLWE